MGTKISVFCQTPRGRSLSYFDYSLSKDHPMAMRHSPDDRAGFTIVKIKLLVG